MVLVVNNVSKIFKSRSKETVVFNSLNLNIRKGEFLCLIGPSGCGKSTLLNIIAGLEQATEGEVLLEGKVVSDPGPDRIMMFQEAALFPWLKVIDNVIFGLKIAGVKKGEAYKMAERYLHMTHLSQFKNAYIHELSGGMRQRVALARCLCMDAEIMLMDEPFGALDSQTRFILQLELQKIWEATKKTIIFVTHSVEEAVLLSDRIVLMSANPGGIKKIYEINLPRPREVDSDAVVHQMSSVLKDLKEEVGKVAKAEFDTDWCL
ncbi:MAG: ABC transporter ATP-binding protein [Tissierellales bacterium]|nr:ABC transporter ATP-binding protein [Tissierellales bacterium]MBN2827317.1 ABC transporter ATP-binding protein [Tissierellales bacterium]